MIRLRKPRTGHVIGISILFGGVFWLLDGCFEYFFFHKNLRFILLEGPETLIDALILKVPPHSLFARLSFIVASIAGGIFTAFYLKKLDESRKNLAESEKRYRHLVETMNEGLITIDAKGTVTYANRKVCDIVGIPSADFIGMKCQCLLDEKNLTVFRKHGQMLEQEGSAPYELTFAAKDGEKRHLVVSPQAIRDKGGNYAGSSAVLTDLTALKLVEREKNELETKLNRSRKMEALGLLAGGVAHDLNNILSGIVSYPELLLLDIGSTSPLKRPLKKIQEAGNRAAAIVNDLLGVARGVAGSKDVLNINTLIRNYLTSPEYKKLRTLYPGVSVQYRLDAGLFNIKGSGVQISKVIMNLVINAAEAIGKSGFITISTDNRYVDHPIKGYDDVTIGEYVMLSVSDNGPGISSADRERIFEPFYTRKVMGRSGTGLGLTVVWSAMQDHNGYIDLISSKKGTTFRLYFPISREAIDNCANVVAPDAYCGNGEVILIVDDEENQREIASSMLQKIGYRIRTAAGGEEAVRSLQSAPADLVVLDMIMEPGMNGLETYREILKVRPGQKAIIASGFAMTDDVMKARRLGAGRFIRKPYTLETIGLAVKAELGAKT